MGTVRMRYGWALEFPHANIITKNVFGPNTNCHMRGPLVLSFRGLHTFNVGIPVVQGRPESFKQQLLI